MTAHSRLEALYEEVSAKDSEIPNGRQAVKTSNHLIKHYGAKRGYKLGSNPYSTQQSFHHYMSKTGVDKMHKHLTSHGWTHEHKDLTHYSKNSSKKVGHINTYSHPNGGKIVHEHTLAEHTHNKKAHHLVWVHGDKHAKPSSLPYYD